MTPAEFFARVYVYVTWIFIGILVLFVIAGMIWFIRWIF